MNPERVASLFRELLQTPVHELGGYARRAGLYSSPDARQLEKARELLAAVAEALSGATPSSWGRVEAAWRGMRAEHSPTAYLEAVEPPPPVWVRELPAAPSLGDPAPGTPEWEQRERERERFVPRAEPAWVQKPLPAAEPEEPRAQRAPPPPRRPPPPPPRRASGAPPQSVQESVAAYAAFCAAAAASPERAAAVALEYGVIDHAALDAAWQDRFDDDPALLSQWEKLFAQFRGQLR